MIHEMIHVHIQPEVLSHLESLWLKCNSGTQSQEDMLRLAEAVRACSIFAYIRELQGNAPSSALNRILKSHDQANEARLEILDEMIEHQREAHRAGDPLAVFYVDAYQSMRHNLFGTVKDPPVLLEYDADAAREALRGQVAGVK